MAFLNFGFLEFSSQNAAKFDFSPKICYNY